MSEVVNPEPEEVDRPITFPQQLFKDEPTSPIDEAKITDEWVRRLKWSTEKPTKAGWYWYRCDEESEPTIMQLHKAHDELFWRDFPGQWAGPVEVPR